jgi:hypothetical protein
LPAALETPSEIFFSISMSGFATAAIERRSSRPRSWSNTETWIFRFAPTQPMCMPTGTTAPGGRISTMRFLSFDGSKGSPQPQQTCTPSFIAIGTRCPPLGLMTMSRSSRKVAFCALRTSSGVMLKFAMITPS